MPAYDYYPVCPECHAVGYKVHMWWCRNLDAGDTITISENPDESPPHDAGERDK